MKRLTYLVAVLLLASFNLQAQWGPILSGSRAASGPVTFTDNMTRANENPISDGGAWQSGVGIVSSAMQIVSNKAQATNVGGLSAAVVKTSAASFHGNQSASITVGAVFVSVCVRVQGTGDMSCYRIYVSDAGIIEIDKCVDNGSTFTPNYLASTVQAVVAGDVLKLEATGTSTVTLNAYLNGTLKVTTTDSTSPYTTGQPGMMATYSIGGGTITNFTATELP